MDQQPPQPPDVNEQIARENHQRYVFQNGAEKQNIIQKFAALSGLKKTMIITAFCFMIASGVTVLVLQGKAQEDTLPITKDSVEKDTYKTVANYDDVYGTLPADQPTEAQKEAAKQRAEQANDDNSQADDEGPLLDESYDGDAVLSDEPGSSEYEQNSDGSATSNSSTNKIYIGSVGDGSYDGSDDGGNYSDTDEESGEGSGITIGDLEPSGDLAGSNGNGSTSAGKGQADISVGTWNANYENTTSRVVAHIKSINADVLGLQEMGGRAHSASIINGVTRCSGCTYAAYAPTASNAHQDPIIWKKDKFKLIGAGSFKVGDPIKLNDGGARLQLLTKSSVWVRLQEKSTGKQFMLSNNHLIPSIEQAGLPYPGRAQRVAIAEKHINGIMSTIKYANSNNVPIFVTGDFNIDFRADRKKQSPRFIYSRFKQANVYANWAYLGAEGSTHGGRGYGRLIDYIHVSKSNSVQPLSQKILGKGSSDHSAVSMKVRLK